MPGVSPVEGTGDMTCALSLVLLAEEAKAGRKSPEHTGPCFCKPDTTLRLSRGCV